MLNFENNIKILKIFILNKKYFSQQPHLKNIFFEY